MPQQIGVIVQEIIHQHSHAPGGNMVLGRASVAVHIAAIDAQLLGLFVHFRHGGLFGAAGQLGQGSGGAAGRHDYHGVDQLIHRICTAVG